MPGALEKSLHSGAFSKARHGIGELNLKPPARLFRGWPRTEAVEWSGLEPICKRFCAPLSLTSRWVVGQGQVTGSRHVALAAETVRPAGMSVDVQARREAQETSEASPPARS
jgi:hypothetical protein